MATAEELRKGLDEVIEAVRLAAFDLKKSRGPVAVFRAIIRAVPDAVGKVEEVSDRLGIKGYDKQQLAVDAILAYVKLPWYIPKSLARAILEAAIDAVVAGINRALKK